MKTLVSKHFYKIIYIFICVVILFSVIGFEYSVSKDREAFSKPTKMRISGTVKSVPAYSFGNTTFMLKPSDDTDIKELVYVKIRHSESLDLSVGDTITLTGTCYAPDGAMNPGSFDFAKYTKSKGACLAMDSDISAVHGKKEGVFHSIYSFRDKISAKILEYIPGDEGGLANALVTGNTEAISEECSESYRESGIYHIVSISGMHLNILILFISFLYSGLNVSRRKKSLIAFSLTLFSCVFMFIFTGFGVSLERAAFMALISCCAPMFMREYSPSVSLFAVWAFILIGAPYYYCNASFCLSFSATVGILLAVYIIKRITITRFKWAVESLIVSLYVTLTTLPFVVHFFGGVSLVSPITNLIVVSIIPILMFLCFLFAGVCMFAPQFICEAVSNVITFFAYCVNGISSLFASLPFAYIQVTPSAFIGLIILALIVFAFFKFKKRNIRFAIVIAVIIANIACLSYNRLNPRSDITFLNAGQGDCTLIHSSDGFNVMIDCGSESVYNFGSSQAIAYLRNQGITKLDYLILTHFHDDHAEGALPLMESGYVENLVLPNRPLGDDEKQLANEIYKSAVLNNIPITHVSADDTISYKKHRFDILNPEKTRYADTNNGSVVIRYSFYESSVLFCGDADSLAQYNMLPRISKCDIVKVAHHGAKTSMSHKLSDASDCKYAVISCGKNNIYSHPDQDTLDAYKKSEILRTDISNAPISFTINKKGVKLKDARH